MHEKAKKLTEETKKVLQKKDTEIATLKKEILARGSEIPKYTLIRRGIRPEGKEAMLVFISKQQVELRDQEISALKAHLEKMKKDKTLPEIQKVEVMNPPKEMGPIEIKNFSWPDIFKVKVENQPDIQRVKVENQKDIQKVKIVGEGIQKVEVANQEKSGPWATKLVMLAVEGIVSMFAKLWATGLVVKVDEERPLKVVMVDLLGRPVKQQPSTIIPLGSFAGGGRKDESPSREVHSGQIAVPIAGQIIPLGTALSRSITIKARIGNTGYIYVGDSNVSSSNGFELGKGDTVSFDVGFLANVFVTSSVNGEGISFVYIK